MQAEIAFQIPENFCHSDNIIKQNQGLQNLPFAYILKKKTSVH